MSKHTVNVQARFNHNPDNGPIGQCGYHAMWSVCQPDGVRGCPLGRGATPTAAVYDLIMRTNMESGTDFIFDDVEINYR